MFYMPELGRFLSKDMVRRPGKNPYPYVENETLNLVDPQGLQEANTGTFSPQAIQGSGYGSTVSNSALYGGIKTSTTQNLNSQLNWATQQQQQGLNIMMPVPGTNDSVMTPAQDYITALQNEIAFRNALVKQLEIEEGVRPGVYLDSKGIPTIGVGFNLTRKDAPNRCQSVGANFADLKSGRQKLTQQQIDQLLMLDIDDVVRAANRLINNYADLPPSAQLVVDDMIFNMGESRFSTFKNLINALENRNWSRAADEMVNSAWYSQVGQRAPSLVNIMRGLSK